MKAIVLAAGVGSRLDPLTAQVPKPMVPVVNRPVLEHILILLKQHGFNEVASNLHYMPHKVRDYFEDGARWGTKLSFLFEEKLSGDAGGVRALRRFLDDDTFMVVMGDLLTDADLTALVHEHKRKKAIATIALQSVADVSQLGVALVDGEGFIKGFQEKPTEAEALSDLASTGIYILEPEVFAHIPSHGSYGFGRQLFPCLVEKGLPVAGVKLNGYWSDVGTIKQYRKSNFDALEGCLKVDRPGSATSWGWLGEGATVSSSCLIEGLLMVGKNSHLLEGVKISGKVVIGDNCTIGAGAELQDTVVWSDVQLPPATVLSDSIVSCNCVVKQV